MKIIKISSLLVIVSILTWGCGKDFLNQTDTNDLNEQTLFNRPDDALTALNGVYNAFHNQDLMIKGLWYVANFLPQDFHNWGSDVFFTTYEIPTNFDAFNVTWVRFYAGISRANALAPKIDEMVSKGVLSEQLGNRVKGELLFLRGVYYYYLANIFGGVPIELGLTQDNGRHPRNTQEEVFSQVVSDMTEAASLLPWREEMDPKDLGRATKGAALAYLGSAQMWLGQYDPAVATFEQLKGHHSLEDHFLDIHAFKNQNGKEDIFSVQYMERGNMQSLDNTNGLWLNSFCLPEEVGLTGYAFVDKKLYESFENADTRKLATVIGPGDAHPDPAILIKNYTNVKNNWGGINTCGTIDHPWKGSDGLRSGYYSVKTWRDPKPSGWTGDVQSSLNQILMKYGDVLLSKAESLYKSDREGEAWDVLDEVRHRANLGPAIRSDFETALINEYRHELGGEYSLYFVLRRGGYAERFVKDFYDITIPPGHTLMPIPQLQIATNEKLLQNPGY